LSQNSKCCSFVIPFTAVNWFIHESHSLHCHWKSWAWLVLDERSTMLANCDTASISLWQ
jgi:hypothetical protein